ncbi:MAG: 4-hydroxyphenylacetate 3-hydroxylase [Ilumatobacteraceae bacterium]|nr:4-hydroxyphenylacetate 3-hydroxylase [Ilumatobacteraceae bacterium]
MAMMTGNDYRASLGDGRAVYFRGEKVADLPAHPVLGQCVDRVADGYDALRSDDPKAISSLMTIPRTTEELRHGVPGIHDAGLVAHVTYTSIMTLATAAAKLQGVGDYTERIEGFIADMQQRDVRITQCITDAKGDRSRHPGGQVDDDAYVHVVDRSSDGVVLRGAKLHITAASLGHELLTIPTKAMRAGEEGYAIACSVPVNAPGVRIVDVSYAPAPEMAESFPISSREHMPEGFVIFDDVFVPNDRIFLDGEVGEAAIFAHSLGLWERLGGLGLMADDADALVGYAQLIAEANGLAGLSHIKEKISEMIIHATLLRASHEAAIANAEVGDRGAMFPSELFVNAGKYHGAANYNLIVRHLHDIAGGSVVTAPTAADMDHPDLTPLVTKYMTGSADIDGARRTKLFHAIRDFTADAYGGWKAVSNLQSGGGLYAQRIVTRRHYDMDSAKRLALKLAGMTEE